MPFFDSTFKEILSSQAASVADGLIARTLLAFYTDKMLLLPGMLILIPGFLEMRGNISGSFSSRIACGLFLGVVKPEKIWTKIVKGNLVAGIIANAIEIPLALSMTFYLFRKGHDPNNVMGTLLTSTGDVISTISLLAAVAIV